MKYKVANVKFNNGNGALLCSQCRVIIAYGFDHTDEEHYCPNCALIKLSEIGQEKSEVSNNETH